MTAIRMRRPQGEEFFGNPRRSAEALFHQRPSRGCLGGTGDSGDHALGKPLVPAAWWGCPELDQLRWADAWRGWPLGIRSADSIEIARKAAGAGCDVRGKSPGGHGFSRWAIRIRIQPVVDDRVPL